MELILKPDLGRKAYRLRCVFRLPAGPPARILEKAKYAAADRFIRDMRVQGWEYVDEHGFRMRGPYPYIPTMNLKVPHQLNAREMLQFIRQGRPLPAIEAPPVLTLLPLVMHEYWEYELAGVFLHKTILMEIPDKGEEEL